jgi:D-alanine-D-alanine ligase
MMADSALKKALGDRPIHVLYGGFSNEREVSLDSGNAVAASFQKAGYQVEPVDVGTDFPEKCPKLLSGTALAFIVLHGQFGEDGEVQAILESLGIAYTGCDPQASRKAMDKVQTKRAFEEGNISTPRWRLVAEDTTAEELAGDLGLPLVIKPSCSGSSLGVSIVQDVAGIPPALEIARKCGGPTIAEVFVPGREVTVGILGDRALPVVELISGHQFYDYDAKYSDDAQTQYLCPAPFDDEVLQAIMAEGLAAHRALGCEAFSRADLRIDPDMSCHVLEVNTIPGFTSHSLLPKAAAAAGISFLEMVEMIALLALNKHEKTADKYEGQG